MSRNRKPARSAARPPARSSAGNTLIGVFIGLVFGALIAAGAAWYFTRSNPFQATPTAPALPAADQPPAALPGKPGGQPVAKQDYEFYNILTQGDNIPAPPSASRPQAPPPVVRPPAVPPQQAPAPVQDVTVRPVPGPAIAAVAPSPAAAPVPATPRERLYLQVGAFSNPGEADNLKARLALAGIQASAQRAQLADGRVVHRVRVGPYSRVEDANPMRARLAEAGFDASVSRVSP